MKHFLICLLFAMPVCAQNTTPAPSTKFDWKLRLVKGQKWTQRFELNGTMFPDPGRSDAQFGIHQLLELHNEVLFANPRFLVLRATFSRFEEATTISAAGQHLHQPDRSRFTRAFVGVPFKIKQGVDGHVLEVSGLQVLAERGRKSLFASAKSNAEKKELLELLPDADTLRSRVVLCQEFQVPAAPIARGETASYFLGFYPSQIRERPATINRTLRFFDGKTARFDENRPRVPDQPKADGNSKAVAGAISGTTTVDVATGLPQSEISIRLDGRTLSANSSTDRYRPPAQEQTRITLKTKLNS